jgi:hypothetical protein
MILFRTKFYEADGKSDAIYFYKYVEGWIMVDTKKINEILGQKYNYENFELDDETLNFVNRVVNMHYNYVKRGLVDSETPIEQKRKLYSLIYEYVSTGGLSLLKIHVENCVNYIDRDSNVENIYINDIFKLQMCKDISL